MSDRVLQLKNLQEQLCAPHRVDLADIGGRWLDITTTELSTGMLKQGPELYKNVINYGWDENRLSENGCDNNKGIPIILAVRNVSDGGTSVVKKTSLAERIKSDIGIEHYESIFYIPAVMDQNGNLNPSCLLLPWFDDKVMQNDTNTVYETYVKQRRGLLGKIPDWKTWLSLAFDLFQNVTGVSFNTNTVFGNKISEYIYVFPDSYIYKTSSLIKSYNLMSENDRISKLAAKLLSDEEIPNRKRFAPRGVDNAFVHSGHVDNLQYLPVSHRTVAEQMIKLEKGGVLAVNAPIGTAPELSVLDTIASRIVNAAVLEDKPPLGAVIVRNHNEIRLWSKYLSVQCNKSYTEQQEALALLGYSWISGSGLITAAVVDDNEICNLDYDNILTVGVGCDRGLAEIDNPNRIKEITERVLKNCSDYFKEELPSLEKCRSRIHETLVSVDYARQSLLQTGIRIQRFIQADNSGQDLLFFPEDELDQVIAKRSRLLDRLGEWARHFKAVPLSLRIGANSDLGKIKLKAYYEAFRNDEEIVRLNSIESYEDVEKGLSAYDQELAGQEAILDEIVRQQDKTERMIRKLGKIGVDIEMLKKYISQPEKINVELDKSLRLLAFWLAVHYYECRWLAGESIVLKHQKGRNDDHSASRYLDRLSLLAPCLFAEADILVKMKGMKPDRLNDLYIMNAESRTLAGVLPVLEFANRVFVMGDPAASMSTEFIPLDQSWEKPKRKNPNEIDGIKLSDNIDSELSDIPGFVSSSASGLGIGGGIMFSTEEETSKTDQNESDQFSFSSNLLVQAADRSEWFMAGRDGIWLFDNIRSYEEIASFASMLWFNDKLKPIRGQASLSGKKGGWLPMSLWQTDNNRAQKAGLEYTQDKEVDEIIRWIKGNYDSVKAVYQDRAKDDIAVIVTQFTAQKNMLKKAIMKEFKHLAQAEIRVAVLDEMIPGETYPIVIFSGVFSSTDDCPLYIEDKTLLYRAVSLAADAFIYFGDINALPEKGGAAASRLRRKLKPLNRKK